MRSLSFLLKYFYVLGFFLPKETRNWPILEIIPQKESYIMGGFHVKESCQWYRCAVTLQANLKLDVFFLQKQSSCEKYSYVIGC